MAIAFKPITAEEFALLDDASATSELIRGELIDMGPGARRHGRIIGRIHRLLAGEVETKRLGTVSSTPGMILGRDPDTVVAPDVAVFLGQYIPAIEEDESYNEEIPQIVVEVVSPSDYARIVKTKTDLYLVAGVRMVLTVWPSRRKVTVTTSNERAEDFSEGHVIDFNDLIPGFSMNVSDIYN